MSRQRSWRKSGMIATLVFAVATVAFVIFSRIGMVDRSTTPQTGTVLNRPVPWLSTLRPGVVYSTVQPGMEPTLLLTHDQALARAKGIIGIPNPVDFIVRRTTIEQLSGFTQQRMTIHSPATAPIVPLSEDASPVAWFVVLHSSSPHSLAMAFKEVRFPASPIRSNDADDAGASGGSSDSDSGSTTSEPLGHYLYVEMDELGYAHNAGFLDVYDIDGDGLTDVYPQHLTQASQLPEVPPSITATPTP